MLFPFVAFAFCINEFLLARLIQLSMRINVLATQLKTLQNETKRYETNACEHIVNWLHFENIQNNEKIIKQRELQEMHGT